MAVFVVVASAPFSVTDALAIMNGAIFGPITGTFVDVFGLVGAALLGYWINLHASSLLHLDEYLHRLPALGQALPGRFAGLSAGGARHSRIRRNGCHGNRGRLPHPGLGSRLDDVRDCNSDLFATDDLR